MHVRVVEFVRQAALGLVAGASLCWACFDRSRHHKSFAKIHLHDSRRLHIYKSIEHVLNKQSYKATHR